MNKHGVSRRWFTDIKDVKSGALKTANITRIGFKLSILRLQNVISELELRVCDS